MAAPLNNFALTPGERLRAIREQLGLTIRMVESASSRIAAKYKNPDYLISLSRLSDIETKGILPNIFRLYSLAVIYRKDVRDLMQLFGVEAGNLPKDIALVEIPNTHLSSVTGSVQEVSMPQRLDPGFDPRFSAPLGRMVMKWGTVPFAHLEQFVDRKYNYGYVGSEDWTMYPLVLPGSFIQIDEGRTKVSEGPWRSEFERPIYFVESRQGYTCCWCEVNGPMLVLKPHPISPVRTRVMRLGSDAEIVGQVVGVAMRLDGWMKDRSSEED